MRRRQPFVFIRSVTRPFALPLVAALNVVAVAACDQGSSGGGAGHGTGPRGETISVAGGPLSYGFLPGPQPVQAQVAPFAISKHPVTVGEYASCVAAGACSPPSSGVPACAAGSYGALMGPTYAIDAGTELPLTCAKPSQAAQFCSWVGGRLPSPEEWLMAARGPSAQPFAWGSAFPDCNRFPSELCKNPVFSVGQHPTGASPSGLDDVLLTSRELVAGVAKSAAQGCGAGAYCVAGSTSERGKIDQIWPIQDEGDAAPDATQPLFGFRCAWEVKS